MGIVSRIVLGLTVMYGLPAGTSASRSLPLVFIPDAAGTDTPSGFMVNGPGLTGHFSPDDVVLRTRKASLRMQFLNAGRSIPEGMERLPGRANFLVGSPEDWRIDVPLFHGILYPNLYPGVDLVFASENGRLKSAFLVAPGADPRRIHMRFTGVKGLHIADDGALEIQAGQTLREDAPVLYQEIGGGRRYVEGRFVLEDDLTVGFAVGDYDVSFPLVIDPQYSYSTLLGGSGQDTATAVAVDATGAAYVAGYTDSTNLPTANAARNFNAGGNDIFVAKMNAAGNSLIYCTYLGGSGDDRAYGMALDSSGSAYVTGSTTSTNFPTQAPLQSHLAGARDAFVLKLNPAGNGLAFSTYLGGSGSDWGYGIALDPAGDAHLIGDTTSINFPATGVQRGIRGSQDAFVTKVSGDGARLLYSTYLGGSGSDHGGAIAVGAGGNAYVTGSTFSTDFPILNAVQGTNAGGQDVFAAKLSADGNSLAFSTYLGGTGGTVSYPEAGQAIALDGQGSAYLAGVTSSLEFPVLHALQSSRRGSVDAFVTKLDAAGALQYSTFLGGYGVDVANGIAVDSGGSAYVVGYTYSTDLPVTNAIQSTLGGDSDAFLARLSPSGDTLLYMSYLGGNGADSATAVALDAASKIYVAGFTLSSNFPLVNSYQSSNSGGFGAFLTSIRQSSTPVLSIAKTHIGSFTQWQAGATYSVTVNNGGGGATVGTVTVTESVPPGMTLASMSGAGWTCAAGGNTCSRGDALAGGASYPPITVTVNVAAAASLVTNQVTVSGGGSANANASDPTTIQSGGGGTTTTSIWSASTVPAIPWHADSSTTTGVKFRSDTGGYVTGIRFYKGAGNNGSHIGLLYTATGTLLAQATFSGETTSGWQQVNFAAPVAIAANTTYVAANFSTTGYPRNGSYFTGSGADNSPLHALRSGVDGPNGVYAYGASPQFPTNSYDNANFWVDVVLSTSGAANPDLTVSQSHGGSFTQGQTGAGYSITVLNGGSGATSGTVTVTETVPAGLTATSMTGSGWNCAQPAGPCTRSDALGAGASYPTITLTVNVSASAPASVTNIVNVSGGGDTNAGNNQSSDPTTIQSAGGGTTTTSIWSASTVPMIPWHADSSTTTGVKFRSDTGGYITGIRFYKGAGNNGSHIGLLYTATGTLLAQATFSGETASGWQQVNFAAPVAIAANTTYVAANFSTTGYPRNGSYFTGSGADNSPLHALRSGVDGPNGVYAYGVSPQFPTNSYDNTNYWVDVVLSTSGAAGADLTVSQSHGGSFTQAQTGAIYSITVLNGGIGATSGTVTVTETVPAGLTATSMTGSGWNCAQPAGPCTRSDALGAGASYPTITLTVNVSASAPASVTNIVNVSGGGDTNTGNNQSSDPTTIQSAGGGTTTTSIWSASTVPMIPWHADSSTTTGVKFRSDTGGYITGIRFYKGAGNNGSHIGLLYTATGTLLAQATFSGETTSGWQQVNFAAPVAIAANTTYVAANFSTTGYPRNGSYFTGSGADNSPLHALRSGVDGPNGVYAYGVSPQFPTNGYGDTNYWVDVVLSIDMGSISLGSPDLAVTQSHAGNFTQGQMGARYSITVLNGGTAPTSGTVTVTETVPAGLTATSMSGSGWNCTQPAGPCTRSDALGAGASYPTVTLTVNVSASAPASVTNIVNVSGGGDINIGNNQSSDPTTIQSASEGTTITSIWTSSTVPQVPWRADSSTTTGVRFRSDTSGYVTGIRFYKGAGNNGSHIGLLYTATGTLLAQATFSGETTSGWQQVNFAAPVAIAANTTYVAANFSTTGYPRNGSYFTGSGADNSPLHALRSGVDGVNGVYAYGVTPQFPTNTYGDANYWVDVVFSQ